MQVLETERLILRHFTLDDAAFILKLLNEPGWKRFIGDRGVNSPEDANGYINKLATSYREHGFGLCAVELQDSGELVGMCGVLKRESLADPDIGFALLSRHEGRGYAQEAVNATLEYARDQLEMRRVVAINTVDNERSARVLERAGMTLESMIDEDGATLRLYAINY